MCIRDRITGQMSIQDVLEEWEKTRHAAEIALKEAEQQKLCLLYTSRCV